MNDRYQHWAVYNFRLLEVLAGWVLFGFFALPGPKFVCPNYPHYFASFFLVVLHLGYHFRTGRGPPTTPTPFDCPPFYDSDIQQEILRDLREQAKAKAE
jgi:hypothetical protein